MDNYSEKTAMSVMKSFCGVTRPTCECDLLRASGGEADTFGVSKRDSTRSARVPYKSNRIALSGLHRGATRSISAGQI